MNDYPMTECVTIKLQTYHLYLKLQDQVFDLEKNKDQLIRTKRDYGTGYCNNIESYIGRDEALKIMNMSLEKCVQEIKDLERTIQDRKAVVSGLTQKVEALKNRGLWARIRNK